MRSIVLVSALVSGLMCSAGAASAACTRLALSDVAFGQEAATKAAREKLADYAAQIARKRKWPAGKGLRKSNETVSCKVYLSFGPFGTEYRCLVTATFCQK
ncbi:MAG: hypothetical protein KDJ36_01405 [Hyphomicrobiaceae bacterium]|nr:hypothetical protein [Hyphomicrobiaceae bacterium]